MAARLGFNATDAEGDYHDPLGDLIGLYHENPEQAAEQLIKHVQRQSINPADVKASFKSRADNPDDWRYHGRKEPVLTAAERARRNAEWEAEWEADAPARAANEVKMWVVEKGKNKPQLPEVEYDQREHPNFQKELAEFQELVNDSNWRNKPYEIKVTIGGKPVALPSSQKVSAGPGALARAATVAKAGIDKLSNLSKLASPAQQVKATPALSAPTKPEIELPVNVKQKAGQEVAESTTVERDGITLDYQFSANRQKLKIVALSNGRRLGSADFQTYGPVDQPQYKGDQVEVDERYRGQGIATVMYDLARELVGRIYPSPAQTRDGEAFWRGKPVWEQKQLTEFDPGENGFGPFKVYVEDYFIGQFPTYEEAMGEVDFLRDADPKSATHHWRIIDGTGETVWEYDIGNDIDNYRRSQKFQRRP